MNLPSKSSVPIERSVPDRIRIAPRLRSAGFAAIPVLLFLVLARATFAEDVDWLSTGEIHWKASPPLIGPASGGDDPDVALKDPTVVFHDGRWHLFATHRRVSGKVDMQYLSFTDWAEAGSAPRHTLDLHDQYHCAPQVFYFRPHQKWYLVYQLADENRDLRFGPCFSTTTDLGDPSSWTRPQPMIESLPEGGTKTKWIDFWVICDERKAHLLYTSDDGHFWRRGTKLEDFPFGWSKPELLLQDTREALFEASCTYKLKGRDQYLTIIEALGSKHRYFKAWIADAIEGPWRPLASSRGKPFAAADRVFPPAEWTTSVSHGELIRSSNDETLEIAPSDLRFVFQGVDEAGYTAPKYGSIPWQIGILEMNPEVR
ncbi:MAG: glycoside hydrolase [Verrucomicrobiae bacterium]|nr:glycoside hydrolase [Verrucomicrobiae bacterium]